MRIAAIYDIHGNYRALEAVLHEVEKEKVDIVIVGGDLAWGPQPRECIDTLFAKRDDFIFIRGNGDREIHEQYTKRKHPSNMVEEVNQWCVEQLTEEQLEWLGSFKTVHALNHILFCHGSPRSDTEAIKIHTPVEEVVSMLENAEQNIIVCGHTHIQFVRNIHNKKVVNAGSVGLQSRAEGACWLLLDEDEHEFRMTPYDVVRAAAEIESGNAPYKHDFADHVLNPPYEGP